VVINVTAFFNALPAILLLKFLFRARLVFYLGDSARSYWVNRMLARLMTQSSEQVITNSESVKRSWVQVGVAEKIVRVIYNGLEIDRFERAEPYDFRSRWGWARDTVVVGFAGQFSLNKGVMDFVAAAENVHLENANCRFVLIGRSTIDDAHEQELTAYIRARGLTEHVVFAGWAENIERFYADLDIVCVPSRHEDPAANVNIEAMASGVPVVATRVGGTPEIIVDGETGLLVEKDSPSQIARAILRLADDALLRKQMGEAGRQRVRRMFDVRKNARVMEEVLLGS
jgi:glycosyltransferase involved in cell wall biosynthesis